MRRRTEDFRPERKWLFITWNKCRRGAVEREAADEEGCEYTSTVKELTYDEVAEQVDKNAASYDLSEIDWEEYLEHFAYVAEGLKNYRDELSKKQSDMDQKICDILHYIELCETDDREAIDLIELLRVCRENRRDIMDELSRIEYFQSNLGTNANVAKASRLLKASGAWKPGNIHPVSMRNFLRIAHSGADIHKWKI